MIILEITPEYITAWHDGVIFNVNRTALGNGEDIIGTAWNGYKIPDKATMGKLCQLKAGSCYHHVLLRTLIDNIKVSE
jgi:hypothetical protein